MPVEGISAAMERTIYGSFRKGTDGAGRHSPHFVSRAAQFSFHDPSAAVKQKKINGRPGCAPPWRAGRTITWLISDGIF
jgi:hypothetical protein